MIESDRPSLMEIDLTALAGNFRAIRALVGGERLIIPALKGNAYGHGAGEVAGALARQGVRHFSAGSLEDALAIRRAVPDARVLVFGGALPQGLPQLVEHGLVPTIYNGASAEAVSRAADGPAAVYVKVDAGLGRLGVALPEALAFIQQIERLDNVRVEGVYTHLPFHDAEGRSWAEARLAAFDELLAALDAAGSSVHVSQALASSGILLGLKSRANAVSPGHLLYGLSPVDAGLADVSGFEPVLKSIKSRLIHVHMPGPRSGYGGAGAPRRVGVLPLGLADGFQPILPGSGARALIAGRSVPIMGVSLEYVSLDLSDLDGAREGDEVVLLGTSGADEIRLAELAAWQGSRPHQCLMSLNQRLPRTVLR